MKNAKNRVNNDVRSNVGRRRGQFACVPLRDTRSFTGSVPVCPVAKQGHRELTPNALTNKTIYTKNLPANTGIIKKIVTVQYLPAQHTVQFFLCRLRSNKKAVQMCFALKSYNHSSTQGGKMKLRTKALLLISIILVAANAILGAALMQQSRHSLKSLIDDHMLSIVNTAADMLDGNTLQTITEASKNTEEFKKIYQTLSVFQNNIGLEFIYAVRETENGSFILVVDPSQENNGKYGTMIHDTEALHKAGSGTPAVDKKPYRDKFGFFYSTYSPVFNTEGKVAGIVAADFNAEWYEAQLNRNARTIIFVSILSLAVGIGIVLYLIRQYDHDLDLIQVSLRDLEDYLNTLTGEMKNKKNRKVRRERNGKNSIKSLIMDINDLTDDLRQYIRHTDSQANAMITAMASDYRSVYYVNLDKNDAVCYRSDHTDKEQTPIGTHFPFVERFTWYAENHVTETYREEFLRFIDPKNIRKNLANTPIIGYRYLVKRDDREYYEMIRMAGVRRPEDRDDHIVHAIGLGLTVIDAEMRETLSKNEALVEALAMAEEANTAKTAFLSNMSHEIRTPMNAIIGLDTLALHDEGITPQTRDYLEKIGASANHLLSLINDILDMSRIESGRVMLKNVEFSLDAMLDQINTMVMSQCRDKGLTYECRILNDMDEYYIGDNMKLKEVLLNILSNAIKFTEAPGSVTLSVEHMADFEGQSSLKFSIKDTGVGMDKEYIPKIFDAFSQEDSSRKNKYGSTGLGMAITKNIVEMMNGTIHVESEKGVGTEFTVTITLKKTDQQRDKHKDVIDPKLLHVLIIDDEEIAAEHAQVVLNDTGIRTDICLSGKEAPQLLNIQEMKQDPYNLVLTDWRMPEMDGIETAREIRRQYENKNLIIILTPYSRDDLPLETIHEEIDGFLTKPLSETTILSDLDRIITRSRKTLTTVKKRAQLEGRRVLLAEDIELNAEIMMDILEMREVEADHAENGRIAVELFEKSEPGTYSAILMDVRMPEMDGLEATAAIRALERPDAAKIPIIALTANAFDEDAQRSLQAGMNAHLTKPVEPDHLYQTLEELIYEAEL